jgi:hypothetical protein
VFIEARISVIQVVEVQILKQEDFMKEFNLAIEKGKRYFEHEIIEFYFIATEFVFKKEKIVSGNYKFEFINNGNVFFKQDLYIDVDTKKIKIENSHEDPLIESEDSFFICGQLTKELINKEYKEIECVFYYEDKKLKQKKLNAENLRKLFLLKDWYSKVEDYCIKTNIDCVIRIHLGKSDSTYYEKEYYLKSNELFNFKSYLDTHEYVAVQCSYKKEFDLEEKHVFKGVKGIFNSCYYFDKEEYIPIFPFSKKYTKIKTQNWLKINNLKDLINYYETHKEEIKKTFEMNENFIIPYYITNKTSAIGKIYSDLKPKKYHINTELCKKCDKRSECMQLIPSGLSELVFKKNLMIETFKNCSINKLIKNKE